MKQLDVEYVSPVKIHSWRSLDPRERDWTCKECGGSNQGKELCAHCLRPHVLSEEEEKQVEASKNSGDMVFEKVILVELPGHQLEPIGECLRNWCRLVVQVVLVDEQGYLLVGQPSDKSDDSIKVLLPQDPPPPLEWFTFSGKTLNESTKAIMKTRFGLSL